MNEVKGDLWTYNVPGNTQIRVITTNGSITKRGWAVMGRGCAKEAADRWPLLPQWLGELIQHGGNIPYFFSSVHLCTLPVKHHWHEKADIKLIQSSVKRLVELAN